MARIAIFGAQGEEALLIFPAYQLKQAGHEVITQTASSDPIETLDALLGSNPEIAVIFNAGTQPRLVGEYAARQQQTPSTPPWIAVTSYTGNTLKHLRNLTPHVLMTQDTTDGLVPMVEKICSAYPV